jgi:tetratricopeptide (TPR) repeat protein
MQDYKSALAQYEAACDLGFNSADPHLKAGEVHLLLGHYMEALLRLRMALLFNPKLGEAHHRLGNLYVHFGAYDLAEKEYKAALIQNEQMSGVHADLGDALTAQGRYEHAVSAYREALKQLGRSSPKGEHYVQSGQRIHAIMEYRAALQMHTEVVFPNTKNKKIPLRTRQIETDSRREPRFLVKMPVNIRNGDGMYSFASVINASKGGLLLASPEDLPLGAELEVVTRLNKNGRFISATGKVVRIDAGPGAKQKRLGIRLEGENQEWQKLMVA